MKVTFLGCGNMGGAISHAISSIHELTVFDTDHGKAEALAGETGAKAASDAEKAIEASECIVLAVKP
ncbi:MAG: pyrroline-5-carboxylate reductase family protein, partial [Bullifex sp.]